MLRTHSVLYRQHHCPLSNTRICMLRQLPLRLIGSHCHYIWLGVLCQCSMIAHGVYQGRGCDCCLAEDSNPRPRGPIQNGHRIPIDTGCGPKFQMPSGWRSYLTVRFPLKFLGIVVSDYLSSVHVYTHACMQKYFDDGKQFLRF